MYACVVGCLRVSCTNVDELHCISTVLLCRYLDIYFNISNCMTVHVSGMCLLSCHNNKVTTCIQMWDKLVTCIDQGCPQDVKSQDWDETETVNLQDRDEKTPTGEVSHLTRCFLRVRSVIFFVIYSHCMHVHKTKVTRPRRSTFKTEMRHSRLRLHPWYRYEASSTLWYHDTQTASWHYSSYYTHIFHFR